MKLTDLYKSLDDLKKFVEINRTGFRKIIKKHDKLVSVSRAGVGETMCSAHFACKGNVSPSWLFIQGMCYLGKTAGSQE
jgi:hypothetical protein